MPSIHNVLVVTKAALKLNWHRELTKWLVRGQTVGIVDSDCWPTTDIVIVNYDILHKYPRKLTYYWDLVVLDEVQAVKNPKARRTKALFGYVPSLNEARASLEKRLHETGQLRSTLITREMVDEERARIRMTPVVAKRKLALTGTPIENRPQEIQPVLAWLQPQEQRWNRWKFLTRYCGGHRGRFGYETSDGGTNLDELRSYLRQLVMVRRLKSEVLKELPPKTRQVIELEATGDALKCVRREAEFANENTDAIESAQAELELAKAGDDEAFKAAVARLKDKFSVAFTEMAKLRHETALAKVPDAIEFIREQAEECPKLIVFAHHSDVLHKLHEAFPGSLLATGETPPEKRQAFVDRFQSDPSATPFFGSIYAMGEGITLTAANLVIFVEAVWVPSKILQCEDRAHRIGQRDNVMVKHLVLKGSLDARVMQTIIAKMAMIEKALDKGAALEQADPLVLPSGYNGGHRKEYREEGEFITDGQAKAIQLSLRLLAGVCDGAVKRDGAGFNGVDARIGHALANAGRLSPAQLALGRRVCRKYVKQLGEDNVKAMG